MGSKETIYQEDFTVLNKYLPNPVIPNFIKQTLPDLKP